MHSADTEDALLKKTNKEIDKEMSEISKIIENSNIQKEDKKKITGIMQQEKFEGPIPHPKILQQYEKVYPGSAKTIIDMAVKEQEHRHEMDKTIVQSEVLLNAGQVEMIRASIKLKSRLQIFGFALTAALVIIGLVCIFLNKNMGTITAFTFAIGSFCSIMFYGKKNKSNESK